MEISPDRPAGSRLLTLARRWFRGKLERGPAMSKRLVTVVSVLALGTLAPPALFAATGRGLTVIADLGALGVAYPTSVVAARRAYVTQDRPAAKKFLMALIEGLHLYRQKKDYAMQVLEKYTKQSNPQILSQSYDYFAKHTPLVPLSDPAVIEKALPSDKPSGRSAKEFYDNSLLQELVSEGFVERVAKGVR